MYIYTYTRLIGAGSVSDSRYSQPLCMSMLALRCISLVLHVSLHGT